MGCRILVSAGGYGSKKKEIRVHLIMDIAYDLEHMFIFFCYHTPLYAAFQKC